jgi:tetratricopeptide (TPR) repeat protein
VIEGLRPLAPKWAYRNARRPHGLPSSGSRSEDGRSIRLDSGISALAFELAIPNRALSLPGALWQGAVAAMNVSLCMIVKNEEANLAACLDSAADLVSEVVVVDTGSTDATKAIAARHHARVFDFAWCDDFAAARNASIQHANGDWVLWLDADDRIDPENHERLQSLLASLPPTRDGYLMRCVSANGGGFGCFETDHVRLFRNDSRVRFRYRVHEQIAPAVRRAGGELLGTDIVIRHDGYADAAVYRKKQERNLRLLELSCQERPLDPFMLYYRGVALLDLERAAEAIVSLTLSASLTPPDTAIGRTLPVHLSQAYEREGMALDAEQTLRLARETHPSDPSIVFAEATFHYRNGDVARVERLLSAYLLMSVGAPRPANYIGDPSIESFRLRHLRAASLYVLGRYDDAERDARIVIETERCFGDAWLLLGDALLGSGRLSDLDVLVTEVEKATGGDILGILLRASRSDFKGLRAEALSLLEEGLSRHPAQMFLERARDRLSGGPFAEAWRSAACFLAAEVLPGVGTTAAAGRYPSFLGAVAL